MKPSRPMTPATKNQPTPNPSKEGSTTGCVRNAVPLLGGARGGLLRHSQNTRGSAVVVMLVILAILGIFVVANAKRLHQLSQELKIVERRQLEKFRRPTVTTNIVERVSFTNQTPITPGEPR